MKIIRARHLGMCFGVRDAIAAAIAHPSPLTILGDLVHNPVVLQDLSRRGIRSVSTPAQAETSTIMITAHGTSQRALAAVREQGFQVLEGTCPLVQSAHHALQSLVAQGCYPIVVGQPGHVEVRGLTGDLDEFSIISKEEDVDQVPNRPLLGVIAQTTQPISRVKKLVALLRARFPNSEIRHVDTVCQPTKQRQEAARELAQQADVVIVVGGRSSNNTRELSETCREHCSRVYQVETPEEIQPEWLENVDVLGLTAGTSTPDRTIDEIEQKIRQFMIEERAVLA